MRRGILRKTGWPNAAREAGIDRRVLKPAAEDLNADLQAGPAHAVKARMIAPVRAGRRSRFRRWSRAARRLRELLPSGRRPGFAPPGEAARPWPLRVARMPEARAEGNGGGPFIFRRGPPKEKIGGPLCSRETE